MKQQLIEMTVWLMERLSERDAARVWSLANRLFVRQGGGKKK